NRTNYDATALIIALDRYILPILILPIACVLSLIQAMLFKIVPFLTWLHLFQSGFGSAPHVRAQIPARLIQLQVLLFLLSLLGLILSLVDATTWFRPAMVMLILNWSCLFGLLLRPGWIYYRIKSQEAST
ncbi:MAG: hypothetical protein KDK34_01995, partial [Leptospiraceae bacterium]|nr:hypothetical protein [Leptospiraceae bacterium]